ncbi:hypothetical protein HDV00_004274 [Rhizophlyctis rosea]|nr:hypothetical protein HDV00_004274 [Rhizophlyctis rosea]
MPTATNNPVKEWKKIGIIGAGSMGSNMPMLFAEAGLLVSIFDISPSNIDTLLQNTARIPAIKDNISGYKDYQSFLSSLTDDSQHSKLIVLSISHGKPTDEVLKAIGGSLKEGDIILDGGNEFYEATERRQKDLKQKGVDFLAVGVSGGYQSARHGPSFSPSGDSLALKRVMPLLEKVAAKAPDGTPCVRNIGKGPAGHFVKMVHNGIEQGMMAVLCEVWGIMERSLGMGLEEIGGIFREWNEEGPLHNCFLISIAITNVTLKPNSHSPPLLTNIQDKVVQDADSSEGTGYWTVREAAMRHVSAPTIAAAHFLRIASADRAEREESARLLGSIGKPERRTLTTEEKSNFIHTLRQATYHAFLSSFVQGLNLIARANVQNQWGVDLVDCIQIWRGGCIIECQGILDLFTKVVKAHPDMTNLLLDETVARELRETVGDLKNVVGKAVEWDANVPALSASLEYIKYCASVDLPTQFMEAQLDYFGAHNFDLKSEGAGEVKKGKYHHEWQPA